MTSIYALIDPSTQQIRYVGKTRVGIERRLSQHTGQRKEVYSSHWIHNLMARGYMPEAVELESGLSESEWPDAEQFWIAYFKMIGANLTNHTNGGHHVVKAKGLKPYVKVSRKWMEQLAKDRRLHGTEHRVLLVSLGFTAKGHTLTQAAIAEALGMPKSQVSVAIKKLVECGAISKIREDRNDGFQVHKSLASRGSQTK